MTDGNNSINVDDAEENADSIMRIISDYIHMDPLKFHSKHQYNEYITYEITQEQADQLLEFARNYDKKYNIVTNNCTTFAVDVLKSIDIYVPTTEKTWTLPDNIEEITGFSENIIRFLGGYELQGYSPADAAEDIAEYKENCDLN